MSDKKPLAIDDVTTGDLLHEMQERGYYVARKPDKVVGSTTNLDMTRFSGQKFRFGIVSDTHLCSRYQQLSHLQAFYTLVKRRKIDTVFHCGDLVDGERMYRGHEYEIFIHGADAQVRYAVDNYPARQGITTYLISGNHDLSFMKSSGTNVVKRTASKRKDLVYLGDDFATVEFGGISIALVHGRAGVAYARSYKLQKIIEQLAPENKPNMLFMGHYHVPCHLPGYRNVESIQMPCFQAQTPYLVPKGLHPFVAGIIVTVQTDEQGLARVWYEWIPFYKMVEDDF